ncbi:disease resistance protein RPM1 [Cannabis sativa]|uniref:disease resistance protein RPM1 n=1 Tax=Cannabis sativa TaxID=3483 RepID=UPI0029CAAA4B|nr:disease resistance protein RPM1 [Cannabis sativa]
METSSQWCNDLGLINEGASTSDPPEVVGFESYEAELEGWLLDNEFKHKVIFIVGMGGLGKTTLAKLVYNKTQISDHFSCKAWVTVSQTFSNQKVIASMVRQFHQATTDSDPLGLGNDLNNHHDQHHQGELLQHLLEEERYMFVFDDVWNVSFCEHLKKVLPETKRGCTIIITTRVYKNLDVWWPQFFFVRVMEMQPLEPTMAFELFSKNVSQQITFFPPEMEKLSHEILQRCEGLPAALVAVGRFLSTKDKTFLGWKQFLEKNSSMLKLNALLKDISESLLPQFGYLPLSIEACFLYFGVYPKDYLVSWKRLVRQLVAEGFVESEDMGNDHLNELVSLSLIQVPDANSTINGKPRWCRVQNLMHEAIQLVCDTKSGFVRSKQPEESNEDNFTDSHIRPRFPYMVGESIDPFNSTKWYANDRYKLLKLLDLEGCGNRVFVPEEVGNLIFLTYLSVRNTTIMMLPKSISKLQRLQTLDLKYSLVCELPIEINNLRELKYILAYYYGKRRDTLLNTVRGVKINEGFGHWDGLRKLYHIEANNDVGLMKELRKFSQLKKLGITKLTKETSRALCTSFDTMYQLENLQLFSLSSDEILDLGTLSFPSLLRSLHLEGCLDKLPGCIPRLQTLERLTLRFSKLTDDPLEDIQYLVSLIKLELYEAYDGEQLRFKNGGFQNLKVLSVRGLSRLNSISIDEWALPYLEEFTIGESTRLKEIPLGIKHLRTLKSLKLYDMGDEFGLSMVPNGGQHYYVVQHIQDVNFYYKRHGGKRYDVSPLR